MDLLTFSRSFSIYKKSVEIETKNLIWAKKTQKSTILPITSAHLDLLWIIQFPGVFKDGLNTTMRGIDLAMCGG